MSHLIVAGVKIFVADDLSLSCEDDRLLQIANTLLQEILADRSPAHGDPRFYVLAKLSEMMEATETANEFESFDWKGTPVVY